MAEFGRILVIIGIVMVLVGAAVWGLGRIGFRGLPGDIRYEAEDIRIYFPIVTCLVLSLILTVVIWFWHWLSRK